MAERYIGIKNVIGSGPNGEILLSDLGLTVESLDVFAKVLEQKIQNGEIAVDFVTPGIVTSNKFITTSKNIIPYFDSFESYNNKTVFGKNYTTAPGDTGIESSIGSNVFAIDGSISLKLSTKVAAVNAFKFLNPTEDTDTKWIPVLENGYYCLSYSYYAISDTTGSVQLFSQKGVSIPAVSFTGDSVRQWVRKSSSVVIPLEKGDLLSIKLTVADGGTSVYFDAIQLEKIYDTVAPDPLIMPTDFQRSGSTIIDGGAIKAESISAYAIAAHTITADQIAAGTITAEEIAAHSITADEIAADTITANEIAADTITASEIAANTITASEIAADTITANEIAADTITASEIAANTITAAEIAADTITANEIAANTITAAEIAVGTITAESAIIADAAITTAKIADAAITNAKIANLAVDNAKIANAAIDSAQIQDANIITALISDAAIVTAHIGVGQITNALIDDASITTAKIVEGNITNALIENGTIKSAKIGLGEIYTANIQDAAINNAKIAFAAIKTANIEDGQITNAKIGLAAIKTANIDDAQITNAKIGLAAIKTANIEVGNISTALIANAAIKAAQIDDLAVTTAKIDNAAITNAKILELDGDKINVNTLNGDRIIATSIKADRIDVIDLTSDSIFTTNLRVVNANITDGTITSAKIGELDASLIKTGTLAVQRLVLVDAINPEKSILFAINSLHPVEGNPVGISTIDASAITPKTITADQIFAKSITADEIFVNTIDSLSANLGTITTGLLTGTRAELNLTEGTFRLGSAANPKLTFDIDDHLNFATGAITWGALDSAEAASAVTTIMEPTTSGLSLQITTVKNGTDPLVSAFTFDEFGLTINNGIEDSDTVLVLSDSGIDFKVEGVSKASFSPTGMSVPTINITSGVIQDSLTIGKIKIKPRTTPGSMDFLWVN